MGRGELARRVVAAVLLGGLLLGGPARAQQGSVRTTPGILQTGTLATWSSATSVNTTQPIFTNHNSGTVLVHLVQSAGTFTAGAVTFEVSYDGTNWVPIPHDAVIDPASPGYATVLLPYTLVTSTNRPVLIAGKGWEALRLKLSTAITGTGTLTPNYALLAYEPLEFVGLASNTGIPANVPAVVDQAGSVTASGTTAAATVGVANGNTLIALCGVNNTGTLSVADGAGNTYTTAKSQTGTVAGALVAFTTTATGSTTVTCTAGTSGVVAVTVYEVNGLLNSVPNQPDETDSGTGTSLTASTILTPLAPRVPNELAVSAVVLTTNNACTANQGWTIDTQQGATGGRLCPARRLLGSTVSVGSHNNATFASASYAQATATFRPVAFAVESSPAYAGLTGTAQIPERAAYVGGVSATGLTGITVCDRWAPINQTANAQVLTGGAGQKIYICHIHLVTATAQNIALVGGTGTTCATSTHAIAGGTTAATGWNFAANGGLAAGSGIGVILQAGTASDNVCLLQSGSGQVSGGIAWTLY